MKKQRDMLPSLADPQVEPNEHCYLVIQDHGPDGGGWGPATFMFPDGLVGPLCYTGTDEFTISNFGRFADVIHKETGKPTKVVKYTGYEVIYEM